MSGEHFILTESAHVADSQSDQDKLNQVDWSLRDKNSDLFRFMQMMIDLRKSHHLGELNPGSFIWHGVEPDKPDFSDNSRLIAWPHSPRSKTALFSFQF